MGPIGPMPSPGSLADVRQQGHEAGPLQGGGDGPLEGGAVAGPLAAEQLALAGAELLEALHVLVVHEGRPRAAFLRAEATAVLAAAAQFLAHHRVRRLPVRLGESMPRFVILVDRPRASIGTAGAFFSGVDR